MEPALWLVKIKITQSPIQQEKELVFDYSLKKRNEIEKTWMRNYFQDDTVYGLELSSIGNEISWEYFINIATLEEAYIKGHRLLNVFKRVFPGLDGKVEIVPIYPFTLEQKKTIYELCLPEIHKADKISLVKNFIHSSRNNQNSHRILRFYIVWQKDDAIDSKNNFSLKDTTAHMEFKVKIFVRIEHNNSKITDLQRLMLRSDLEFLAKSTYNVKMEKACITKTRSDTWKRILEGNCFWKNSARIQTGKGYNLIKNTILKYELPHFISPKNIDFNFPRNSGLPQPFILENEKIIDLPITADNNEYVWFGKLFRQGVLSGSNAYFRINDLTRSCVIVGNTGSGKTYCASKIVQEIATKAPQVGILTIGLAKKNQERFFYADEILTYGDDDLKIPYFVKPNSDTIDLDKYLLETASYLTASLGLKGTTTTVLNNVMMGLEDESKELPKHPKFLFEKALDYLDNPKKGYHEKFHSNITSEIRNKVLERLSSENIEKTLGLTSEVPRWFIEWRNGKNFYFDLTECSLWTQRILTNALFQMIKTLTSTVEANQLNNLIVIDEPDAILAQALSTNPYNDNVIAKMELEEVFRTLIEEYRSRGLGFIIIDQTPSNLFRAVTKSPSLKIVFKLDLECGKLLTLDQKELNYLKNQEKRRALVFNGATSEEYIIKTLDIEPWD
jgi:hypothetical protein